MNELLGWMILGVLVVALSVLPPYFASRGMHAGAFWEVFRGFNLLIWGALAVSFVLAHLILWALHLIGFLQ